MRNVLYASVAAGALLAGSAAPSYASLILSLSDGTTSTAVFSGTGLANFMGDIGNFVLNVTTGVSKPVVGTATQPILDLNSIDVTGSAGGVLTLKLTDTDFIGSGAAAHFMESVGGTLSAGSYSVSSFMDCGNTPFAQSIALTSESFSGSAFSGSQGGTIATCAGSYSLTQVAVLTLPGSGEIFSGDSSLAIPEPSTLALFGAGLLALGFGLRRKYVTTQTEGGTTAA